MIRIPTTYDASKKFKTKKKTYVYYKSKFYWEQVNRYFLLNPEFDFNKNLDILKQRFKEIEGEFRFFFVDEKYPTRIEIIDSKQKQLSLF